VDDAVQAMLRLHEARETVPRQRDDAIREAIRAGWRTDDLATELQRRLIAAGLPERETAGLGASVGNVRAAWAKR
jgi:hypothetical protein